MSPLITKVILKL